MSGQRPRRPMEPKRGCRSRRQQHDAQDAPPGCSVSCSPPPARCTSCIKGARHLGAQTRAANAKGSAAQDWGTRWRHETEVDSEAGMLSGISRKRSIRSNPCWFTEFCKSQCLSHFAAPFIVVRAETSVAESCKEAITVWRSPPTGKTSTTHKGVWQPNLEPVRRDTLNWFKVRP